MSRRLKHTKANHAPLQVYEAWVKCTMNPFYDVNQEVTSPIFRSRVAAAAKRFL
jgi:hypothetical protein